MLLRSKQGADLHRVGTRILPKQEYAVSTTPQCSEETLQLRPPVQGQELGSVILMGPSQPSMFYDSAIDSMILFHSLLDWASGATGPCTKQFAFNQLSGEEPYGFPGAHLKKIGFNFFFLIED